MTKQQNPLLKGYEKILRSNGVTRWAPALGVWLVDRVSKDMALQTLTVRDFSTENISTSFLSFKLIRNPGIIFGLLSESQEGSRTFAMGCIGLFIILAYFIWSRFLTKDQRHFQIALSIGFGAICGNLWDRIFLHEGIVDFIQLSLPFFHKYVFNLADIFLWVALIGIAVSFREFLDWILPLSNRRNVVWIRPKFQKRFVATQLKMQAMILTFAMFICFFFFRVAVTELGISAEMFRAQLLAPFVIVCVALTFSFLLLTTYFNILQSHRMAGPLVGLQRYMKSLQKNDTSVPFKLRNHDEFQEEIAILAELAKDLAGPKNPS